MSDAPENKENPEIAQDEIGAVEVVDPPQIFWNFEGIFNDMETLQAFIGGEDCWSKSKSERTLGGIKTWYRCNKVKRRGPQCSAELYTIHNFEPKNEQIKLYRKNLVHDHENHANKITKVAQNFKDEIIDHFKNGFKPKGILYKFQDRQDIVKPSIEQVRNVIEQYKEKNHGQTNTTMNDLLEFYEKHKQIPENQDEPFIANFKRSPKDEKEKCFRLFITTKRLLFNSSNTEALRWANVFNSSIVRAGYKTAIFADLS